VGDTKVLAEGKTLSSKGDQIWVGTCSRKVSVFEPNDDESVENSALNIRGRAGSQGGGLSLLDSGDWCSSVLEMG